MDLRLLFANLRKNEGAPFIAASCDEWDSNSLNPKVFF